MPLHPPTVPVPGQTPAVHTPAFGQGVLQSRLPPQPSPMVPQYWPPFDAVHVPGVQLAGTQTLLALQTWPDGQAPQGRLPPQPSPTVPQNWLPALPQVSGTQPAATQTLLVQLWPVGQSGQVSPCPQPSPMVPQKLVEPVLQVAAWQLEPPTQTLSVQVQSALQFMPQSILPLQPLPMTPQYWPPSGLHETPVLHDAAASSPPPSGTMMLVPPPLLVPLLPAPDEPVAPLLPVRVTPLEGDPLEQLAIAIASAP